MHKCICPQGKSQAFCFHVGRMKWLTKRNKMKLQNRSWPRQDFGRNLLCMYITHVFGLQLTTHLIPHPTHTTSQLLHIRFLHISECDCLKSVSLSGQCD